MIAADPAVEVWAIPGPGGGNRAFCDRMNSWAQAQGQPGLGYIFFREARRAARAGRQEYRAERTDAIAISSGWRWATPVFFVAGKPENFASFAGAARDASRPGTRAHRREPLRAGLDRRFSHVRVERRGEAGRLSRTTRSPCRKGGLEALETRDPLTIPAHQYDIVCNGFEIASGAIRNHKAEIMRKAFAIAGYGEDVLEEKFGGMLRALQFGAPPHGGMAAGLDRIVMLVCGAKNLREITMFPMNQQAQDLLMGAPSEATPKQLRELSIRVAAV
jgi:aspartyl-tRNA synthetase